MFSTRFVVAVVLCVVQYAAASCPIETRSEWGAHPPVIPPLNLTLPLPYVVIHHSYTPTACATKEACLKAMKSMQHMHQTVNGWNDIGYNFAIGSDGRVYEGRGWDVVGAHAKKYNLMSVGICFIGDYRNEQPPPSMLQAAHQLIECGVARGSTQANYTVVGHRQVRDTECPGDALYKEIQGWTHWRPIGDVQTPDPGHTQRSALPDVVDSNNTTPDTMDNSTTHLIS